MSDVKLNDYIRKEFNGLLWTLASARIEPPIELIHLWLLARFGLRRPKK